MSPTPPSSPPPTGPSGPPPGTPPPPPPAPSFREALPVRLLVGVAAAVAGFVLEISVHSYRSENGLVVDCDYRNYGPLLLGPVAVWLGLQAVVRGRRSEGAGRDVALGALVAAVGVLHVLRGLGVVDLDLLGQNPC